MSSENAQRMQQTLLSMTQCFLEMTSAVPNYKELWDKAVYTANLFQKKCIWCQGKYWIKRFVRCLMEEDPTCPCYVCLAAKNFFMWQNKNKKKTLTSLTSQRFHSIQSRRCVPNFTTNIGATESFCLKRGEIWWEQLSNEGNFRVR